MSKAILVKVGERPATRRKFKEWRVDLSDKEIERKMTSLPSTIIDSITDDEAQQCKKDFESCLGTEVEVRD